MNLFETICRNARYLKNNCSLEEKKSSYKEHGSSFNKEYWAFVDSLTPSFLCPIEVIEDLTKEEYDFEKHIEPLIKDELIWIREWVNCFPHSENLAQQSKRRHGLVKDYKTKQVSLQFFLGPENPNKDHKFGQAWL
jgi:hypothetical protein